MMTGERRWEPTGSDGSLIPDVLMSEVDWAISHSGPAGRKQHAGRNDQRRVFQVQQLEFWEHEF